MPVVVTASPNADDAGKAGLMTAQWDENQQRRGLTTREQAEAITQLAAFGVSPAQITKRLRVSRAVVDAATSLPSTETLDAYELTIPQAAVVAEFQDDQEAVQRLVAAAPRGQFDHVEARLRQDRACAEAEAAKAAELAEKGVTVLEDWPEYGSPGEWIHSLRTADNERIEVDEDEPGDHMAALLSADVVNVHKETGERVPEWMIYEDDEADHAPSHHTPRSMCEERMEVEVRWYCVDPAARGWKSLGGRTPSGPLTEEQAEAKREADREARRDVVAANKAWLAAEEVRRSWLRTFCNRKTAPKGSAAFVTETLLKRSHLLDFNLSYQAINYVDTKEPEDFPDAKATMTTLALALVAHEVHTCKEHWRSQDRGTGAYLRFIEGQGYALSPVERRACGEEVATDDL